MKTAGIEYDSAGNGPPVVCLHGIGGGIESFRRQLDDAALPQLAEYRRGERPRTADAPFRELPVRGQPQVGLQGFRVVAWNMPGYGMSETSDWPPDFGSLSRSLGRFLAEARLEPAHLVGHSIGGMLALEHALRRPEQVATMVLVGTTPSFGGRDPSFTEAFLKARLELLERGTGMAGMARVAAPTLVGPDASPEAITEIETIMAAVPEATWRGILECLVTFNRRNDLGRVRQRCCLIAGAHDRNAPPRTMERMSAKLVRAEYHLIASAGHMINQEAPTSTNMIIGGFLRRSTS
ncbi:MAG: alpha/beta hydrolase [Paracoccaceae bacterium]|nr:alpha/beta hydrolase [Paracoccaceae bacterium]